MKPSQLQLKRFQMDQNHDILDCLCPQRQETCETLLPVAYALFCSLLIHPVVSLLNHDSLLTFLLYLTCNTHGSRIAFGMFFLPDRVLSNIVYNVVNARTNLPFDDSMCFTSHFQKKWEGLPLRLTTLFPVKGGNDWQCPHFGKVGSPGSPAPVQPVGSPWFTSQFRWSVHSSNRPNLDG